MNFTYLALGDSYTIGEQVAAVESFPYQTMQLLRQSTNRAERRQKRLMSPPAAVANPFGGWQISDPEVIAKNGWATDELKAAIDTASTSKYYNIVSLLIGVNNQYRNISVSHFRTEFNQLLLRAIQFANNQPHHVFVLSIPDWGVTPFAEGRNRLQIAREIDKYNAACKTMTEKSGCHFIDITSSQREDGNKADFLAADGLHPSAKEYAKWAVKLGEAIKRHIFLNDNG